jgi:hypothetical protein
VKIGDCDKNAVEILLFLRDFGIISEKRKEKVM